MPTTTCNATPTRSERRRRGRVAATLGALLALGTGAGAVALGVAPEKVDAAATSVSAALMPARAASDASVAPQAAASPAPSVSAPADLVFVNAATVPGMTIDAPAGAKAEAGARPGTGVRATPAVRARAAAEERASRDAARAMLDARPGFARPVHGTHLTSTFGPRWGRMHKGLDFAGPVGLPIRAVAAGTVTIAEEQRGYGNVIEVQHADGGFSRYGHLDLIRVHPGDQVTTAQIIGALGNTGRSTGPHLHFEVRTPAGTAVDPLPWLRQRGVLPAEVKPAG